MKDNLFRYITLKNIKSHFGETRVLIICVTLFISLMYAMIMGFSMFSKAHSVGELLFGEDSISRMFTSAGMMMLLCGVILLIMVLISYLEKRVPDFILLRRMGISFRDLKTMMRREAGIVFLFSAVLGFFIGSALGYGLKFLIHKTVGSSLPLDRVTPLLYLPVCGAALFIYFLSFLLVRELEGNFRLISRPQGNRSGKKLVGVMMVPKILIGVLFCVVSAALYARIRARESTALLVLFVLGLYLVGRNATALYLHALKASHSERYYRSVVSRSRTAQRLNPVSRMILLFSLVSVLACFCIGFRTIAVLNAQKPESLYPYDFMCIADGQDQAVFKNLQRQYSIKITRYPMVRVANYDKTEHIEISGETPIQGQQIGISESTYNALKKAADPSYRKKPLHLDAKGKSVYIVHQQDSSVKAQPLDWTSLQFRPLLHVGIPALDADQTKDACTYKNRKVAGQEISSLTGCFSTPKGENLVVFSDAYFPKARQAWKKEDADTAMENHYCRVYLEKTPVHRQGPVSLVLINAKASDISAIDAELQKLEKRHQYIGNYDPTVKFHYCARTSVRDMKTERVIRTVIGICLTAACAKMQIVLVSFWIILSGIVFAVITGRFRRRIDRERS